jgi:hypothetical protein
MCCSAGYLHKDTPEWDPARGPPLPTVCAAIHCKPVTLPPQRYNIPQLVAHVRGTQAGSEREIVSTLAL